MKWTKAFRKSHGKELKIDSVFEFERRRDEPVKYDRELMAKTLTTMKRVAEIKAAREARFYKERMKGKKTQEKKRARQEIAQGINLVSSSLVRQKQVQNDSEKTKVSTSRNESKAMET
jgi:large subunit ribosomal protein L24e